jgi:membrane-associated protease RseP (regulator of RpoE activity)
MFEFLVGNDLLSGIVAFILVLIPAVLIHELGHFAAAKLVGITILEFGIGMPPQNGQVVHLQGYGLHLKLATTGGLCPASWGRYGAADW